MIYKKNVFRLYHFICGHNIPLVVLNKKSQQALQLSNSFLKRVEKSHLVLSLVSDSKKKTHNEQTQI